jgi:hypothetical protein
MQTLQKTEDKTARLRDLESQIEMHLANIAISFYEIGLAFRAIREEELYASQYTGFKIFCENNRAKYRLCYRVIESYIKASFVVDCLRGMGFQEQRLPQSESVCRPLLKLKKLPEKMIKVWSLALADTENAPTAAVVSRLVAASLKPDDNYIYRIGGIVKMSDVPTKNGTWGIVTKIDNEFLSVADYTGEEMLRISDKSCFPLDYSEQQEAFYSSLRDRMESVFEARKADEFILKTIRSFSKIFRGQLTESEETILKTLEKLCL